MTHKSKAAFTLVEVMIVILILGLLLSVAVPNFLKARSKSRVQTIVMTLKEIESAKEQYAMDTGKVNGDPVSSNDLVGVVKYLKNYPENTPVAGTYLPGAVGEDPTFRGHTLTEWQQTPPPQSL